MMTFIDLMNRVFWKFLEMFFIVFNDDILVHSRSEDDHMKNLRIESKTLKYHKVFANFNKSTFWLKSLAFLGHIVSRKGIEVYPKKTLLQEFL